MSILQSSHIQKIIYTLLAIVFGMVLSEKILWFFASFFVLTLGIIHGANDLFLFSKTQLRPKKHSFFISFFAYLSFVLAMAVALFQIPQWALFIFVAASSFHFGEQQWHLTHYPKAASLQIFYVAYGLLLFSLLFFTHTAQTTSIVADIISVQIPHSVYLSLLMFSLTATLLFLGVNIKQLKSQLLFQFIAFILFVVLFTQTSLLWSFAVYFVLWHSIPSLQEQANLLYPKATKPVLSFFRSALPYWLFSLAGLGFAFYLFQDDFTSLLSLFFGFLAAITIPHVIIIFWMHQEKGIP